MCRMESRANVMSSKNGISKKMRDAAIAILRRGEMLPPEFAYDLFPSAKKEYELVYRSKTREEDVLAQTMAPPLQRTCLFGNNGRGWHNKLVFGDNLQIMKSLLNMKERGELCNADGSPGIRLAYIDPPFATKQELRGGDGGRAYQDKLAAAEFLEFIRRRLILIRELLSDDGSVYVHLDYRMSAYVRVLMDEIFGRNNFCNEIVWRYKSFHGQVRGYFPRKHDSVLFYKKSSASAFTLLRDESVAVENLIDYKNWKKYIVNGREIRGNHMPSDVRFKRSLDKWVSRNGRQPTKEDVVFVFRPQPFDDVWDIPYLDPKDKVEKVGYPTQKPEALLERIIKASSKKGDIVADFFCGSGTTCAVAEKLSRRWVGGDCGKLAIYTVQKRMFNLRRDIGNKGDELAHKPFALYNAGLYDIKKLWETDREGWRKFALMLFECSDEPHKVGGIQMDGRRKGESVMVFNHHEHREALITEQTLEDIHTRIKRKTGNRVYIIAPALSFQFFQDYVDCDNTRYYALRIPYSFIDELHRRDFSALLQSQSGGEEMLNECVDAVGFDFINPPEVKYSAGVKNGRESGGGAFIKITTFKSQAHIREPLPSCKNMESFSMLMLDYNYEAKGTDSKMGAFELDEVFFAADLKNSGWTARFDKKRVGEKVMAIFADIYGNEARRLIPGAKFHSNGRVKKGARK